MSLPNDSQLLISFANDRSEAAFTRLVDRYLGMVYAAALRQVRDPGTAEDVAQAVFIVLARKAGRIDDPTALPAWLLKVTRLAARDAMRRSQTRRRREQEAVAMPTPEYLDQDMLSSRLDDALAIVGENDRNVIALRFLNGKSLAEVGNLIGISEAAAGKRLQRGLTRLRKALAARGFRTPGDFFEADLARFAAVSVPAALAAVVMAGSISPASASAAAVSFSKGAMLMTSAAKLKFLLTIAAIVLIMLGGGFVLAWHLWSTPAGPSPAQTVARTVEPGSPPQTHPADPPPTPTYTLKMANGAEVEVVGICRDPRHSNVWFGPDGTPLENALTDTMRLTQIESADPTASPGYTPLDEFAYAVRVTFPEDGQNVGGSYSLNVAVPVKEIFGVSAVRHGKPVLDPNLAAVYIPHAPRAVAIDVTTACGPWETIATFDGNERVSGTVGAVLTVTPSEASNGPSGLKLTIPGRDEDHFDYRLQPNFFRDGMNRIDPVPFAVWFASATSTEGTVLPPSPDLMAEAVGYTLQRSPKVTGQISGVQLHN